MRFESKRDLWIVLMLRVIPIAILAVIGAAWYAQRGDVRGPLAGALILIAVELFFFESILRSTYYVIEGDTLLIRSSFIKWRVPIREVTRIAPTRSALSSPALSLDRLRIEYSGKAIMISPDDKERFIEAMRSANPAIIRG
jgi:PH (Pleckstrin Homology) domain-containing protein